MAPVSDVLTPPFIGAASAASSRSLASLTKTPSAAPFCCIDPFQTCIDSTQTCSGAPKISNDPALSCTRAAETCIHAAFPTNTAPPTSNHAAPTCTAAPQKCIPATRTHIAPVPAPKQKAASLRLPVSTQRLQRSHHAGSATTCRGDFAKRVPRSLRKPSSPWLRPDTLSSA
jgi:hypothetical protein